jgi:hypothetical protein
VDLRDREWECPLRIGIGKGGRDARVPLPLAPVGAGHGFPDRGGSIEVVAAAFAEAVVART